MAEADYEQRMRELQRQYVDFLDDSDRDGVYDRSDRYHFLYRKAFSLLSSPSPQVPNPQSRGLGLTIKSYGPSTSPTHP